MAKKAQAAKFQGKNKLPPQHNIQILRGLATRLINSNLMETDYINGEEVYYSYRIAQIMADWGYNPQIFIPQMIKKGYLFVRETDPESYYVCKTLKEGTWLKKTLAA